MEHVKPDLQYLAEWLIYQHLCALAWLGDYLILWYKVMIHQLSTVICEFLAIKDDLSNINWLCAFTMSGQCVAEGRLHGLVLCFKNTCIFYEQWVWEETLLQLYTKWNENNVPVPEMQIWSLKAAKDWWFRHSNNFRNSLILSGIIDCQNGGNPHVWCKK